MEVDTAKMFILTSGKIVQLQSTELSKMLKWKQNHLVHDPDRQVDLMN